MGKIVALLLFLGFLFFLSKLPPVLAQLPIKDSVTIIVGSGEGGTDPGPGPGTGPAPSCDEIDQKLRQDFGIRIQEGPRPYWLEGSGYQMNPSIPGESADCEAKQGFWRIFARATQSWKYRNRLLSQNFTIQLFRDLSVNSFGVTSWSYRMQLKNGAARVKDSFTSAGMWIIHESGHLLEHRDNSLEPNFDVRYFKNHGDSSCYIGDFLKTYGCMDCDVSPIRESLSEAIGLYIYNSKDGEVADITNFKNQCQSTYNWIKDRIYGGDYEFN